MSGKQRDPARNMPSKNDANDGENDAHPQNDANPPRQSSPETGSDHPQDTKTLHPENPALIRELRERYTLTARQAKQAIARGLGASKVEAYRAGGTKSAPGSAAEQASASRALSDAKVESAADDVFSRHFQQLKDQGFELDEQRILADLELFKKKAVENQQLSAGVKATELQGRAIGVEFTTHQKTEHFQQLSDADILNALATDNPELARELRQAMAIPGEYEHIEENKPAKSDTYDS